MTRAPRLAIGAFLFSAVAWCQTVGVFLQFDSAPNGAALEVMKREVDTLLRPSGVSVGWRMASENRGNESFANLVLLNFKGKCRVEPWSVRPEPGQTRTLGATKVADGHVLPFSEVKCDAVKQALSYLRPEANSIERQNALGLAMGRVVAHELYHVLANATAHAARGLAKAAGPFDELVSVRPAFFSAEAVEAIRKALH
jgi:hypothetical protein